MTGGTAQKRGGRPTMLHRLNISTALLSAILLLHLLVGGTLIVLATQQLRRQALKDAETKASILLDHNLAIHTYFSHQLKPALFELVDAPGTSVSADYFEPRWMSSTYAVREIDKYFKALSKDPYYYKESAMNARHPENEADPFERRFLRRLNREKSLERRSDVRTLDGKQYFTLLRRGEAMESACLRCHSTAEEAPGDLVKIYGPGRSFGRKEGETVSAVSLRVPLESALSAAKRFSVRLGTLLLAALAILAVVQLLMFRYLLFSPLSRIRGEITRIARSGEHLGKKIRPPFGRELREMTRAFNRMSENLLESRTALEARNTRLAGMNRDLEDEMDRRRRAEAALKAHQAHLETLVRERTQTLRKSEERYRVVSEMVSDYAYSFRVEKDGTYAGEWVTDAFERVTGYRPEAFSQSGDWATLYHPEDLPVIRRHVERVLTGEPDIGEFRFVVKDGRVRWVRSYSCPVWDSSERRVARIYGAVQDITARKEAESRLEEYAEHLEEMVEERTLELRRVQAECLVRERLAVLGHFAGSISHEIRNPLAAIDSSAYLLKTRADESDENVREHLDRITANVRKGTAIVQSLLDLSRMEKPRAAPTELTDLAAEVVRGADIPDGVEVRLDPPEVPVWVDLDAEQIRMALRNIIQNAVQAMDGPGTLTVSVRSSEDGRTVDLAIADTGPGIAPENIDKVFEPLFSTKTHGIGFGLSITKMIVENHGGTVQADSPPDGGARFVMTFPKDRSPGF